MATKFHNTHKRDSHSQKYRTKSTHDRFKKALVYTGILSFAVMLALSNSWAKPKGKKGKKKSEKICYSKSIVVNRGMGGNLKIVEVKTQGIEGEKPKIEKKIEAKIKPTALDSYMEMLEFDSVEISVELVEK